jgi:hypothetical protein
MNTYQVLNARHSVWEAVVLACQRRVRFCWIQLHNCN